MEGDFLLPPPPIVVNPPKVAEEVNVKAQNSPDVGTAGAVTRAMSHGGSDSGSPDCVATGKMASMAIVGCLRGVQQNTGFSPNDLVFGPTVCGRSTA